MTKNFSTATRVADFHRISGADQLDYLLDDPMAASDWDIFDREWEREQAARQFELERRARSKRQGVGDDWGPWDAAIFSAPSGYFPPEFY